MDEAARKRQFSLNTLLNATNSTLAERLAQQFEQIENSLNSSYVPVTDAEFNARLEKALQKNFDYIKRKDSEAVMRLLNPGVNIAAAPTIKPMGYVKQAVPMLGKSVERAADKIPQESLSVYISGLPTDITQEELEILFGPVGKIKKVKIYTAPTTGKPKGDALITYSKSEEVSSACYKFHNLDFGEGCILSVTRAAFGSHSSNNNTTTSHANSSSSGIVTSTMLCTVSAVDAKGSDIKESIVSDYEDANELDRCYDVCHRGFGYLTSTDTKSNSNDNVGNKKKFDAATCSYTYQVNDCSRSSSNSNNNTTTTTSTNSSTNNNISGNITTRMDALLYTIIEPIAVEMEVNKYATLIIMNTFDSTCDNNNNAAFFADLEADMLLACCQYGNVRTIQLLTLTNEFLRNYVSLQEQLQQQQQKQYGNSSKEDGNGNIDIVSDGVTVVTFELESSANDASNALRGRWFDARQLLTYLLLPVKKDCLAVSSDSSSSKVGLDGAENSYSALISRLPAHIPPPPPPPIFKMKNTTTSSAAATMLTKNTVTVEVKRDSNSNVTTSSNNNNDISTTSITTTIQSINSSVIPSIHNNNDSSTTITTSAVAANTSDAVNSDGDMNDVEDFLNSLL